MFQRQNRDKIDCRYIDKGKPSERVGRKARNLKQICYDGPVATEGQLDFFYCTYEKNIKQFITQKEGGITMKGIKKTTSLLLTLLML